MIFLSVILAHVLLCNNITQTNRAEDFVDFLLKFSSDKGFQLERISFPLTKHTYTKDLKEKTTVMIEKTTWESLTLVDPRVNYLTDIGYGFKNDDTTINQRVFMLIGLETGIDIKYFFERENDLWYLIRIVDYST